VQKANETPIPPAASDGSGCSAGSGAPGESAGDEQVKECRKCGQVKPLREFYRDGRRQDGHEGTCKVCRCAAARRRRRRDKARTNARQRERWRRDPLAARCKQRRRRARNPEVSRRASRRYEATHKEARRAYCSAYRRKNRHKTRTHALVKAAVTLGVLVRGPCEVCGARQGEGGQRIYAHHEDYARPLAVRWLCARHHMQVHAGIICLLPVAVELPRG